MRSSGLALLVLFLCLSSFLVVECAKKTKNNKRGGGGGGSVESKAPSLGAKDQERFHNALNRGANFFQSKQMDAALQQFDIALQISPLEPSALFNKALVFEAMGKVMEAIELHQKVVQHYPDQVDVYRALGRLYHHAGQLPAAIKTYETALKISPKDVGLLYEKGNTYSSAGQYPAAVKEFTKAVKLDKGHYQAYNNMGTALMSLADYPRAIDALRKCLKLIPGHTVPLFNLVVMENRICDWTQRAANSKTLQDAVDEKLKQGDSFISPFHAFEFDLTPEQLRENVRVHSERARQKVAFKPLPIPSYTGPAPGGVVNVGYVSGSGFKEATTTARMLQGFYGMHDRRFVKVFCYSLSNNDGTPVRQKIQQSCDVFRDLVSVSPHELADVVRGDQIQFLVDLTGFTVEAKPESFALQQAPIQVNWHGFPGTMAAPFISHFVTDRLTSPPDYAKHYTEALVYMRGTYLISDHKQSRREVFSLPTPGTQGTPTRKSLGFDDEDFIYCSFNQLYKIDPHIFSIWMRILKRVPKSKLWLLDYSKDAIPNLRKEAKSRGVDPKRLIFSEMFPKEIEFAAKSLADVFLDTTLFNAHTTGSDILWLGVPVITRPGLTFASRVASGLVQAIDVMDTLVRTDGEYEDLAVALAQNTQSMTALRAKMIANRETTLLYDTQGWTQTYEKAIRMVMDTYYAGMPHMHTVPSPVY